MIVSIRDQYREGARVVGTELEILPAEAGKQVRSRASRRFSDGKESWLWERFTDDIAIQDDRSWKWVDEYIAGAGALIFFNEFDDSMVFSLPMGAQLVPILLGLTQLTNYGCVRSLSA